MNIGIDARLIGQTGVGRYITNLIRELGQIDLAHHYVVFLPPDHFDSFQPPNTRWEKRLATVRWHTISEQFVMPWLYLKEHLDLVHVPYFNAPLFYPGKFILTIHDITILHVSTGKATTLPNWMYRIRRIGYLAVLSVGLARARHILTVSQTVKDDIVKYFSIFNDVITVTYEGVDPSLTKTKPSKKSLNFSTPYFLYVGNVYPHKNAETLIHSFRLLVEKRKAFLVMVGKHDFFYERIRSLVGSLGLSDHVRFLSNVSDETLASLYANAAALVFPSLYEGFGLPAVEALALGCPVIASDIPIFHEILGDMPTFFDPNNSQALSTAMDTYVKNPIDRVVLQGQARTFFSRYNWEALARKTLSVYDRVG